MEESQLITIIEMAVQASISDAALDGVRAGRPTITQIADRFARGVAVSFRVPGEHMYEHAWPADWKEAIKDRFFPMWMRERWPIRYERVSINALYPKLKLPTEPVSWNVNVRKVS